MGNIGMKLKGTHSLTEQMHLKCNEDEKYWMVDALDELKSVSLGRKERGWWVRCGYLDLSNVMDSLR